MRFEAGERALELFSTSDAPVVKMKLLNEFGSQLCSVQEWDNVYAEAEESGHIKTLRDEQESSGGYGRFHSMDSSLDRKLPTMEAAAERMAQIGLRRNHSVHLGAKTYCERLLQDSDLWPEGTEPNDRWETGQEMFVASTLSWLDPENPLLDAAIEKWIEIAQRTFAGGLYDQDKEVDAHCEVTGATTMRNRYLTINNRYAVRLLGCRPRLLSDGIEKAYVKWLYSNPTGIGYLNAKVDVSCRHIAPRRLFRWIFSHILLSSFESYKAHAERTVEDLLQVRNGKGMWDFGPKASDYRLHLSETWRGKKNRETDHTVWVISLVNCALRA